MQNLHPLFVHFPVALISVAVILELAAAVKRTPALDLLARWFLYLGATAAALTVLTGWLGEQSVAPVAAAHEAIEKHEKLGFLTLGTVALLAFWRGATTRAGGPRPRWLFVFGTLGLLVLLWETAHEGGELVYEYGVGTELTAPDGPLGEEPVENPEPPPDVPTGKDFR